RRLSSTAGVTGESVLRIIGTVLTPISGGLASTLTVPVAPGAIVRGSTTGSAQPQPLSTDSTRTGVSPVLVTTKATFAFLATRPSSHEGPCQTISGSTGISAPAPVVLPLIPATTEIATINKPRENNMILFFFGNHVY